jgi:hypothetical protein
MTKKISAGRTKKTKARAKKPNQAKKPEADQTPEEKLLDLSTLQALAYDQAMQENNRNEQLALGFEKQAAKLRKEGGKALGVAVSVILEEHGLDSYPFSPCAIEPVRDEGGRIQQLKFTNEDTSLL